MEVEGSVAVDLKAELGAMKAISEALEGLPPASINRVLRWAADAHMMKTQAVAMPLPSAPTSAAPAVRPEQFADIPALFEAAQPSREWESVLAMGYWFQVVKGHPDIESYTMNQELKHLGHNISNITRVLDDMMARKPALVVQTKKGGDSKQARKKFRLTFAGLKTVEELVRTHGRGEAESAI
jgi:hypothetical protein